MAMSEEDRGQGSARRDWPGKGRMAIFALIFFGIGALFLLAWHVRHVLLLLFAAVLVAVILRTVAAPFQRWLRLPDGLALTAAILSIVGTLALLAWLVGSEIVEQVSALAEDLPRAWAQIEERAAGTFGGDLMRGLRELVDEASVASSLGQIGWSLGRATLDTVIVIVAGIYLAATPASYRTGILKIVPRERRQLASETIEQAGTALGLWLKGQVIQMVLIGTLTTIGLMLIGMPSAVTLGLLAGFLEFVPFLGPIAAAIPALLLAATLGWEMFLWTLGLYLLIQQIEGNVIHPMVQQRTVSIPPVVLLFGILLAAPIFGLPGILLAAPLAVFFFVLIKRLYVREALDTPTRMPGDDTSAK